MRFYKAMHTDNNVLDFQNLSVEQTKEFNKLADMNRKEFNKILSSISSIENTPIEFFLSSIMSREPEFSPLFERCCKLAFIKHQIVNREVNLIILKDYPLYKLLKKYISHNNLKIQILNDQNILNIIQYYLFPVKNLIRSISFLLLMLIARNSSESKKLSEDEIILISTHILKDIDLNKLQHNYIDRNFAHLVNYVDHKEKGKIAFIPQFPGGPRPYRKLFKILRGLDQKFIIKADYLKLKDYFYAYSYPFKLLPYRVREARFLDFDIASIMNSELWNLCFDYKTIESLLNLRISKRLRQNRISVKILIDWYENQLSSKGLIYGFKKAYPESKVIGYQGIIDSASYRINIRPTKYERDNSLTPDIIAVIGDSLIQQVKEFDKNIKVVSSPAFRYHYLWDRERKINNDHFTILVALPIFHEQAENILEIINQSLNSIKKIANYLVLIKTHPTQKIDRFKSFRLQEKSRVNFVDGDFINHIESADLLVSSASTTCMEAIALGVPVAIIGAKCHILQNPIPSNVNNDYWQICYTDDELVQFIQTVILNKKNNQLIDRNAVRRNYFIMPEKENVNRLLNLDV